LPLQGVFKDDVAKLFGSSLPVCASSSRPALSGFPDVSLRFQFNLDCIPSCGFAPLQGLLSAALASCPAPLLGIPCRLAHAFRRSPPYITPEGSTLRVRSVFRVSHPLHGLLLPRPRGFVSPHKRLSTSPFRGFPSRARRTNSSLVPDRRDVIRIVHSEQGTFDQRTDPRSLNCVTTKTAFAVLPRLRVRTGTAGFIQRHRPSPSWALSSPGSSFRSDAAAHHCRSSRVLRC